VRVAHRGVVRLLDDNMLALRPDDRVLRFVTLAFDPGDGRDLPAALGRRDRRGLFTRGAGACRSRRFLTEQRISVLRFTAGLFRTLAEDQPEPFACVRHVLVDGDALPADVVGRLLQRFPDLTVSNAYGPTEATV
jgi:non-ribosomal peptide synthetase component F